MTEDEAKTKWCPAVRIAPSSDSHHAVTNREDRALETPGPVSTNCIGSACMAWRRINSGRSPTGYGSSIVSGYCGLAGAPQ